MPSGLEENKLRKKEKREKKNRKKEEEKEKKKEKKGCQQHPVFPGGHPSKY